MLAMLMPLNITTTSQRRGLVLYVIGTLSYFCSWIALINWPNSAWSAHPLGFLTPAYTPLFWLLGIGMIGNSFYFHLPFRKKYFIGLIILFLTFHVFHAVLIYNRHY